MVYPEKFDVIVVGGGHAGCEAALACARMGLKTLLLTLNLDTIGQMSCNPSVGGIGKSHLVFEVDALGGEIGFNTDKTGIGFKMLNTSKGPAVWALRAQVDRKRYREEMQKQIFNQKNLKVKQVHVGEILLEPNGKRVKGVKSESGMEYHCDAVILTTGTFLNGTIHIGLKHFSAGRLGEPPATELAKCLVELGFKLGRLKTGTSPRVDGRTIDFSKLQRHPQDEAKWHFSHRTKEFSPPKVDCWMTHTTPETHEIILKNLDRSPLYTGKITGTGVRYCPSLEDKVVKFRDKAHHQVIIEPDGLDTHEYYLNGVSTSLPEDVQIQYLRTIPGLEKVEVIRPGYGIEYDFVFPSQIYPTMETKKIENLYFAGQINGTTGYEEAAAQGIIAGINAALKLKGKPPFIPKRSESYLGVLIDDLTTKEITEPYRMFTTRAEYRLILRQDNADERLMKYGVEFGLVSPEEYEKVLKRKERVQKKIFDLKTKKVSPEEINPILEKKGSSKIKVKTSLYDILKRPEIKYDDIKEFAGDLPDKERLQVETEIKYEGYIEKMKRDAKRMEEYENKIIPDWIDYDKIQNLSFEAREKLKKLRPMTLGQASRIDGVTPADIFAILVEMKKNQR